MAREKKQRNRPKKSFLYGMNSIKERLKVNPSAIRKIYIQDNFDNEELIDLIKKRNIFFKKISEGELIRMKKADRLQGIIAEIEEYQYIEDNFLLNEAIKNGFSIICLDNINDPHNLGSILRICACFGKMAVVIPKHNSVSVNDTVMHVASGGENYVKVCVVDNMSRFLMRAKEKGLWVVGTVVDGAQDITKTELPLPVCLVLGSEGKGIRAGVEKHLDMKVKVPMKGAQLSFNVAMAAAMFCYEIARQRKS
jgi:23S rRNA (guanosine2251-2'-O)-methyltransferase